MPRQSPNIIYILADDMGYGDLSCLNGQSAWQTPHLDRLAREGLTCRDAHSSSAVCTPSRYNILTGRYNWRSSLKQGVLWGYSRALIEENRLTVAELLRRQGYATACFGKWHLGWTWPKAAPGEAPFEDGVAYDQPIPDGPLSKGFDRYFGIPASLDMDPYVYVDQDRPTAIPDRWDPGRDEEKICFRESKQVWRPGPVAPDFVHEEVLQRCTDEAVRFIREQSADQPFFVYFPLPAPHTPILPTGRWRDRTVTRYGDFCLQVDDVVGQLLKALDERGIVDDTWVIFTSDNGCSPRADFPQLAQYGHNPSYIFRGHKADIYEGGHRVPLLMRWPATIRAGSVTGETLCLGDFMATCADILGVELPDDAAEDSVSQLPILRGEPIDGPLREATVHHSIDGSFSIRQGRWKLECCPGSGGWSWPSPYLDVDAIADRPRFQLYDLKIDVREHHNRVDDRPDVVERLIQLLARYVRDGRSTSGAPQPDSLGPDATWDQLWWLPEKA
ncbi:MAG: sulfatase family protein [Opitutales bacterium]